MENSLRYIVIIITAALVCVTCAIELETEPVEIEVELKTNLNCQELDVLDYLSSELCIKYDPNLCCTMAWSDYCDISFCDGCIGISEGCYYDIQQGEQ
jgi:hypothetical protein